MSLREKLLPDYDRGLDLEGFSGDRLADRLSAIAEIGLTTEAGSCRPGYSQAERQAKDLVCDWMRQAGLAVRRDAAGNCFGRLAGRNDHLPVILCGSHIDTVPNGGHFDGVLGVLLALEAVAPEVERAVPPVTATYEPRPGFADYYAGVRTRFEDLYPVSIG